MVGLCTCMRTFEYEKRTHARPTVLNFSTFKKTMELIELIYIFDIRSKAVVIYTRFMNNQFVELETGEPFLLAQNIH